MTTTDPDFLDSIIDVANAMRLVAHNSRAETGTASFRVDGGIEIMNGVQCRSRITRDDGMIVMAVEPFPGIADEFEAIEIRIQTRFLEGSPLLDVQASVDGSMTTTFATLFDPIQNGGEVKSMDFGGEPFGLLVETLGRRRTERAELVNQLIRGTDAIAGGTAHVLIRHAALGAKATAIQVDEDGSPFVGTHTAGGTSTEAQSARLAMIATWAAELPEALMLRRIGDRIYDVAPLGYTYASAADDSLARHQAMVAYAKLHAFGDPEQ